MLELQDVFLDVLVPLLAEIPTAAYIAQPRLFCTHIDQALSVVNSSKAATTTRQKKRRVMDSEAVVRTNLQCPFALVPRTPIAVVLPMETMTADPTLSQLSPLM